MPTDTEAPAAISPEGSDCAAASRFSLTRGGPLYRFQQSLGASAEERTWVIGRAAAAVLITWLPLLLLSLAEGLAHGGEVRIPFLRDFAANVRFLIALPLLITAEIGIDCRLRLLVTHFVTAGVVPERELPAFEAVIGRVSRLRDRVLPEAVILALAFAPALSLRHQEILIAGASSWHTLPDAGGLVLSRAGWWFALVSAPIFRFLLLRWLWRILLWAWFLRQVSRLKLVLIPTHPDLAAGLGFLSEGQLKFGIIGFAGSAVIAAQLANALVHAGATVVDLKYVIAGYCAFAVIALVAPLLILIPTLVRVKKEGLLQYGALACRYTRLFDRKWIHGRPPDGEALLGSADIQSLADLNNSFAVIREMRTAPIDRRTLAGLAVAALLPMIPVVLLGTPAEELVRTVLKLLV